MGNLSHGDDERVGSRKINVLNVSLEGNSSSEYVRRWTVSGIVKATKAKKDDATSVENPYQNKCGGCTSRRRSTTCSKRVYDSRQKTA